MAKLSILMATTDGKIKENESFFLLPFYANFTAIIVNQKINSTDNLQVDNQYITVLNSNEKGISNSRNLALSHANSDYVHFCDDDVVFMDDYLSILNHSFQEYPEADFFQFEIKTPEGNDYKSYSKRAFSFHTNSVRNRRKILLMSSVEIVAKRSFIQAHTLQFSPEFGIGSEQFPMGEEALFLMDALAQKARFQFVPKAILIHPKESSGGKLGKAELHTLGFLFKRVYGPFGGIFNFYYAFKKRKALKKNDISIAQAIRWMKPEVIL